jgi:hypothetical protein
MSRSVAAARTQAARRQSPSQRQRIIRVKAPLPEHSPIKGRRTGKNENGGGSNNDNDDHDDDDDDEQGSYSSDYSDNNNSGSGSGSNLQSPSSGVDHDPDMEEQMVSPFVGVRCVGGRRRFYFQFFRF